METQFSVSVIWQSRDGLPDKLTPPQGLLLPDAMNTPKICYLRLLAVAGSLSLVPLASLRAAVIDTSGNGTNLAFGLTWSGGVVPWIGDTANFVHGGEYYLPDGAALEIDGITINAEGVEFKEPSAGPKATIKLGAGGLSGTQSFPRFGSNNGSIVVDVGEIDQTWSVALPNTGVDIAGSATITYTSPVRLWLRGAAWQFSGVWRADGGFIHPDTNAQWAGTAGATGQFVNGGIIRLSNSLYDRMRIEAVGDGFLRVSGGATNDGSYATLTSGGGEATGNLYGAGSVTVDSHSSYGTLKLTGEIFHEGDTIVADEANGMYLELTSTSRYTSYVSAGGVSNKITGQSPTNSHLKADGTLNFNIVGSGFSDDDVWTIVDVANLDVVFGGTFAVEGFTAESDGVTWTRADGEATWTFSENDGTLRVSGFGAGAVSIFESDPVVSEVWKDTPLGHVYDSYFPWVFHQEAGSWFYIYAAGADRNSFYGYDYDEGFWFWSSVLYGGWFYNLQNPSYGDNGWAHWLP